MGYSRFKVQGSKSQLAGFTLIEVLVSLAVVASLVTVLYSLLYHLNLTIEEEELLRATLLAKEKIMEEPVTSPPMKTDSGRFEPPDERFYYKRVITDTPFSGVKLLTITVGTWWRGNWRDLVKMERLVSESNSLVAK